MRLVVVVLAVALVLALPGVTISEDAEVVALRRRVQELEAEVQRVKADAYDRTVTLEQTTKRANDAILEGVRLVRAKGDSALIEAFKKAGYPM